LSDGNKKKIFVIILLGLSLTVNTISKKFGYFAIAGISTLFGYAVALAWLVESIIDKRKEKKRKKETEKASIAGAFFFVII
jgi:ABC-type Co2+ transport system permease subunit